MAQGTTTQRRRETPERWQAALERAFAGNVAIRQLSGSGQWIATSASDPGTAYEVSPHRCTCPAAVLGGDPVCLHRAALRHAMGMLERASDTPKCPDCGGTGYEETWLPDYRTGGTICTGSVRCTACDGVGVLPHDGQTLILIGNFAA